MAKAVVDGQLVSCRSTVSDSEPSYRAAIKNNERARSPRNDAGGMNVVEEVDVSAEASECAGVTQVGSENFEHSPYGLCPRADLMFQSQARNEGTSDVSGPV